MLTLVVIPVVYNLLDRRSDAIYRERGERKARSVIGDAALAPEAAAP
jgi:HAE1 family hydrophobic/amphiphilic exporter-1